MAAACQALCQAKSGSSLASLHAAVQAKVCVLQASMHRQLLGMQQELQQMMQVDEAEGELSDEEAGSDSAGQVSPEFWPSVVQTKQQKEQEKQEKQPAHPEQQQQQQVVNKTLLEHGMPTQRMQQSQQQQPQATAMQQPLHQQPTLLQDVVIVTQRQQLVPTAEQQQVPAKSALSVKLGSRAPFATRGQSEQAAGACVGGSSAAAVQVPKPANNGCVAGTSQVRAQLATAAAMVGKAAGMLQRGIKQQLLQLASREHAIGSRKQHLQ